MNSTKKTSIRHALGILIPITLLSLLISAIILSAANDVYAFIKPDHEARLSISSPCTLDEFSILLKDTGVINNPTVFKLYVISKDKQKAVESFNGELLLNSNLSYRQILHHVQDKKSP